MQTRLLDLELTRYNWSELNEIAGPATGIPDAIVALVTARSSEEVNTAYWQLENHVVVQGQSFSSAEAVVSVLLAALADGVTGSVKVMTLELLFQIVAGGPHEIEIEAGNADLAERCHRKAREGLWLLYQEAVAGDGAEQVLEILERIDPERWKDVSAGGR